jgi:L-fucose mutarotase/ribose pyranase (RbsD/FucU family)
MQTTVSQAEVTDLVNEPQVLREVHAIRLMIHDETNNMTAMERTAYFHERAALFFLLINSKRRRYCNNSWEDTF